MFRNGYADGLISTKGRPVIWELGILFEGDTGERFGRGEHRWHVHSNRDIGGMSLGGHGPVDRCLAL